MVPKQINYKIRNISNGVINSINGISSKVYPADYAWFYKLHGICFDPMTNLLYAADVTGHKVYVIQKDRNTVSVVAGNGQNTFFGDEGPAIDASLHSPHSCVVDPDKRLLYITDTNSHRVRVISLASGNISTVVGYGNTIPSIDSIPIDQAKLEKPVAIAIDTTQNILYIGTRYYLFEANLSNQRIRRIAGSETSTYCGDNHPAIQTCFAGITSIALDSTRKLLYISDSIVTDY